MKLLVPITLAAIASLAFAADDLRGPAQKSPVLRRSEPEDSVVFRLPGIPRVASVNSSIRWNPSREAVPVSSPLPTQLVLASLPPLPVAPATPTSVKPAEEPAHPALPAEAVQDLAFYCHRFVGKWRPADARALLGAPLRNRPAYDENNTANGRIYAFRDPSHHYREVELDFDARTGALRTVFVYPPRMTWQEVRRRWTGPVNAADAAQGRKFYSYSNRRMDVLVDAQGHVISLGLY